MQGADKVNGELEVGYDQRFEKSWSRAETVGRGLMALFLVAGLIGLFGRGPLSHHTNSAEDAALAVDFEPVARSQTGTQVTLHLSNPTESPTMDVFVGSNIGEPMGLQRILPQPVSTRLVDDGMVLTVAVTPGTRDSELRFMLQPTSLGPNQLVARLADHEPLRWTQFVVP